MSKTATKQTVAQWAAETVAERLRMGATDAGHDLTADDVAHLRKACGDDVDPTEAVRAVVAAAVTLSPAPRS